MIKESYRLTVEEKLEKARKWIKECETENEKILSLPRIWGDLVKTIHKDIQKLFEVDIKELLENYISSKADIEAQSILLEGLLAKVELLIRKKLREN